VGTPYHMIVMVALSARTRDEQILKLAPGFFEAFPTVEDLAEASVESIVGKMKTIGLFRQKAKNLQLMARKIVEEFGGEVPRTMEELVTLPGVGRKTASVILVAAFGQPAIAVDTHVQRVVNRLGWVKTKSVEATEQALLKLLPESMYEVVNRVFVPFGRTICIAKPRCWACPLVNECPFSAKNLVVPKGSAKILGTIDSMRQGIRDLKAKLHAALR
ncbi:MAG: endonuclease III, partial [Methylococcaceae bacterium]